MRTISTAAITKAAEKAVMDCNHFLPYSLVKTLKEAASKEKNKKAKNILFKIVENYKISKKGEYPLCQDTGISVVFIEIGSGVKIDGDIYTAINEGIKSGYKKAYLRKSTADPVSRVNYGTNTPAIIHTEFTAGSKLTMHIMTKGAGAENKSVLRMLSPGDGTEGIIDTVVGTVKKAGASACPPYIIGVGVGGNFETAPLLAKKALLRDLRDVNTDRILKNLEKEILSAVNNLGIGPMGMGGALTALAVKINKAPCHIASLPVAVNIQCHSARHKTINL